MPKAKVRTKMKTRKSVTKRVRNVTRTGKVMVRERSNQHLAARKSKRQLAHSGRAKALPKTQAKNIKAQLG